MLRLVKPFDKCLTVNEMHLTYGFRRFISHTLQNNITRVLPRTINSPQGPDGYDV